MSVYRWAVLCKIAFKTHAFSMYLQTSVKCTSFPNEQPLPIRKTVLVHESDHCWVPIEVTNSSHVYCTAIRTSRYCVCLASLIMKRVVGYIIYQNNEVQFSASFWYQRPQFGPPAHGLFKKRDIFFLDHTCEIVIYGVVLCFIVWVIASHYKQD